MCWCISSAGSNLLGAKSDNVWHERLLCDHLHVDARCFNKVRVSALKELVLTEISSHSNMNKEFLNDSLLPNIHTLYPAHIFAPTG